MSGIYQASESVPEIGETTVVLTSTGDLITAAQNVNGARITSVGGVATSYQWGMTIGGEDIFANTHASYHAGMAGGAIEIPAGVAVRATNNWGAFAWATFTLK